ncbi:hypothetical protein ACLOJK_016770 [Asimina triloba]
MITVENANKESSRCQIPGMCGIGIFLRRTPQDAKYQECIASLRNHNGNEAAGANAKPLPIRAFIVDSGFQAPLEYLLRPISNTPAAASLSQVLGGLEWDMKGTSTSSAGTK